jgi:hypothetical protein
MEIGNNNNNYQDDEGIVELIIELFSEDCPVCMTHKSIPSADNSCSNGHFLCNSCKIRIFQSNNIQNTCPICRTPIYINNDGFHRELRNNDFGISGTVSLSQLDDNWD